jgi:hypothetical protein
VTAEHVPDDAHMTWVAAELDSDTLQAAAHKPRRLSELSQTREERLARGE